MYNIAIIFGDLVAGTALKDLNDNFYPYFVFVFMFNLVGALVLLPTENIKTTKEEGK